jgi:pimeloyl-ACP methyl ester carboxylesterase
MKKEIKDLLDNYSVSEYEKLAKAQDLVMSDNTSIRVLTSKPEKSKANGYVLFVVPGWSTVVPAWEKFLMEAMKDFEIVYFESREKASSGLTRKSEVGMPRMALDLKEVIEQLKLDEKKLVMFGSCIGATTIVCGLVDKLYNPHLPVLVAPPARFEYPEFHRPFIAITPSFFLNIAKPLGRFWLIKFKSGSPQQAAKYIRALEEADGFKWKKMGLYLAYKRYWKVFPLVENHVLLIAAENDKMHDAKVTRKVKDLIKNAQYIDLKTNENTHSKVMIDTIREHIPKFKGLNH